MFDGSEIRINNFRRDGFRIKKKIVPKTRDGKSPGPNSKESVFNRIDGSEIQPTSTSWDVYHGTVTISTG